MVPLEAKDGKVKSSFNAILVPFRLAQSEATIKLLQSRMKDGLISYDCTARISTLANHGFGVCRSSTTRVVMRETRGWVRGMSW